jgi:hypothetical protein
MYGKSLEVVDKFNCLRITLENRGGWNKQEALVKTKAIIAVDKCLATTSNVQMLQDIYETLCEARIMYGVELWGLDEA